MRGILANGRKINYIHPLDNSILYKPRTVAFNWFDSHRLNAYTKRKATPKGGGIYREPMGIDSIKVSIPSSRNRATVHRTVAFKLFDSHRLNTNTKTKATPEGGFCFGGTDGNRTHVRKQLGRNFSGCSLLFTFPHPGENKHSTGISSFIMHGTLKALRTHVLHSNHTRARLVDLPGRMGA